MLWLKRNLIDFLCTNNWHIVLLLLACRYSSFFFFDCDTFSLEKTCIWHMHSSIRYKSKTLVSFGLWKIRHDLISVVPFRMCPQLFGQNVEFVLISIIFLIFFVLVSIIFLILIFFVVNIYYITKRWGYYIQYCEFDIIEAKYLNF